MLVSGALHQLNIVDVCSVCSDPASWGDAMILFFLVFQLVVTANRYDLDVLDNSGHGTGSLGALGKL